MDWLAKKDGRFRGMKMVELGGEELVGLCDPRQSLERDDLFYGFWARVKAKVSL
jgi:hypothetical protein